MISEICTWYKTVWFEYKGIIPEIKGNVSSAWVSEYFLYKALNLKHSFQQLCDSGQEQVYDFQINGASKLL